MASGAIEAGAAFVRLFLNDADFRRGLAKTQSYFESWGRSIASMGLKLFAFGDAIAGAVSTATIAFAKMGAELARAAERTGVGVEALSELRYAAAQAGVDFDSLQRAFARMDRNIVQMEQGMGRAQKAFKSLGISSADLAGKTPLDRFKLIAEKISQIQDPTERAGLAMEVFGSSSGTAAAKLLNLLDQGAAGITKLMSQAHGLGLTISTQDAKNALELDQRLSDLWATIKVGAFVIGGAFLPEVRSIVVGLTQAIGVVRRFIDEHKGLATAIATGVTIIATASILGGAGMIVFGNALRLLAVPLGILRIGISGVAIGLRLLSSVALTMIGLLPALFTVAVSPAGALLIAVLAVGAGFVVMSGGARNALNYIAGAFGNLGRYLSNVWAAVKADSIAAFNGITAALATGNWALAGKIAWAYLKLEWDRGIAALRGPWLEFKSWFFESWITLMDAVNEVWISGISDIEQGWNAVKSAAEKAINWIVNTWKTAVNYLADTIQQLFLDTSQKELKNSLAIVDRREASGYYSKDDPAANAAGAEHERAAIRSTFGGYAGERAGQDDSDYKAKQKAIDDAYAASQGEISDQEKARRKELADSIQKRREQLEDEIAQAKKDGTKDDAAALAAAQKELADLIQKAADEAAQQKPNEPVWKQPDENPDDWKDSMNQIKQSASGTFNPAAISEIWGGSGIGKQIADHTAATRDAVNRVNDTIKGKRGAVLQ